MTEKSDITELPKPKIFGREIASVPCLRSSLLDGIIGGLTIGMGYFLYTSNVHRSTRVALGSYVVLTSLSWINCRRKWSAQEEQVQKFREAMTIAKASKLNPDKAEGGT